MIAEIILLAVLAMLIALATPNPKTGWWLSTSLGIITKAFFCAVCAFALYLAANVVGGKVERAFAPGGQGHPVSRGAIAQLER